MNYNKERPHLIIADQATALFNKGVVMIIKEHVSELHKDLEMWKYQVRALGCGFWNNTKQKALHFYPCGETAWVPVVGCDLVQEHSYYYWGVEVKPNEEPNINNLMTYNFRSSKSVDGAYYALTKKPLTRDQALRNFTEEQLEELGYTG